jgi:hypothetical protein
MFSSLDHKLEPGRRIQSVMQTYSFSVYHLKGFIVSQVVHVPQFENICVKMSMSTGK